MWLSHNSRMGGSWHYFPQYARIDATSKSLLFERDSRTRIMGVRLVRRASCAATSK